MRSFFLGDSLLDRCGIGGGKGGYTYVCNACGKAWGRIQGLAGLTHFIPLAQACGDCGKTYYVAGSFLKPLVWWDFANGNTLEQQLGRLSEKILRHEALMAANFLLEKQNGEKRNEG